MHSADSSATKDTTDEDSPPGDCIVRADGNKGSQEYEDRYEEGDGGETARVRHLQLRLSICQVNGSVTNKVLGVGERTPG